MNANHDAQDLWKRNEATPPEPLATEICALARRRERASVWERGLGLFALAGLALAFAHNTWQISQPWVRLGQGWMLLVMTVYLWNLIRNRTHVRASGDSCAGFLLRSLKMKRDGYLAIRRIVLLIIPALLVSWWGRGGALRARAIGLDPSSAYYRYLTSIWPIIATIVLLLLVWAAFSKAAKKASAEFETLRQRVASA
jgi:hypothetical protein